MSWSKVNRTESKPIGWWYYKILCEVGWLFRRYSLKMYYRNLNKLCAYGYNLYGNEISIVPVRPWWYWWDFMDYLTVAASIIVASCSAGTLYFLVRIFLLRLK